MAISSDLGECNDGRFIPRFPQGKQADAIKRIYHPHLDAVNFSILDKF